MLLPLKRRYRHMSHWSIVYLNILISLLTTQYMPWKFRSVVSNESENAKKGKKKKQKKKKQKKKRAHAALVGTESAPTVSNQSLWRNLIPFIFNAHICVLPCYCVCVRVLTTLVAETTVTLCRQHSRLYVPCFLYQSYTHMQTRICLILLLLYHFYLFL